MSAQPGIDTRDEARALPLTMPAREIRGLVARRREVLTTLGATFAALGIVLDNVLQGSLPPALRAVEGRVFATYTFLLLVPSLILALRLARLNAGMVLNGVLFARCMQEQSFTAKPDLSRAARVNFAGVSFLISVLVDVIAGISATLLALAIGAPIFVAIGTGLAVIAAWLALYLRVHAAAARFALERVARQRFAGVERADWEAHVAGSLEDSNQDMVAILALTGLMVFSCFQSLSGLGSARGGADLPSDALQTYGPAVYALLMTATCFTGMLTYLRLRLAAGSFARLLDPEDRPFRALKLTDSLLGYTLLAFLFAIALHVLLFPALGERVVLAISAAAFAGAVALEQLVVYRAGR